MASSSDHERLAGEGHAQACRVGGCEQAQAGDRKAALGEHRAASSVRTRPVAPATPTANGARGAIDPAGTGIVPRSQAHECSVKLAATWHQAEGRALDSPGRARPIVDRVLHHPGVRSQHSARAPFGALIRCLGSGSRSQATAGLRCQAAPVVVVAELDGIVSPVASEYIAEAIARAEAAGAECVILELDTPGGLYKSTRVICKAILAARVPFVTYVAPAGSRATSAGVFITYASHVAAMHPTSSLGAATPVSLSGPIDTTMARKAESDAGAFIRSLAERNGRNADWAELAVHRKPCR